MKELLQFCIETYRDSYGKCFWFHKVDWEEYKRQQGAKKCLETKKEKYEIYEASYGTATTFAGRALKFKEVRLQEDNQKSTC